ncbi:MAG TPA: hypothetical protein VF037_09255 [Gemmatimonadales bacterium]
MTRLPIGYAGWELRDMARGPGAIILAIAALVGFILSRLPGAPAADAGAMLTRIADQAAFPLVLVVTAGMVSRDIGEGYYRAWFSRPVSPPLFYLQRFLVGGVIFLLFLPLLAIAVSVRTGNVSLPAWVVGRAALLYLLTGGTVFFLSTLVRRDWMIAALVVITESVLHQVQRSGAALGPVASAVYEVLPPYHVTAIDAAPSGRELAVAAAYGVAIVAAALAVLRRKPLGSGGRA